MSKLKVLKEYLVGEGGYLLNDDNNGKTVMLSGAWGSGKTHFWQNEIVREQKKVQGKTRKVNKYSAKEYKEGLFFKLKKKACVYVSLYGKDNIEDIKSEVFLKAYSQLGTRDNKDKSIDTAVAWLGHGSKIASAISFWGIKIDTTQITDKAKDYQDNEKLSKAQEAIKDGGVICFDDFERKSKNIDLNDLFGVITQLSLDFNCKVVIILNSNVFEGEEANIFKRVKEKTINKFFSFKPSIEELFESIYESDDKYKRLDDYKIDILKAINDSEELNARIYIQVLDNCLEWISIGYNSNAIRVLTLVTINFILNDIVLSYKSNIEKPSKSSIIKMSNLLPSLLRQLKISVLGISLDLSNEDLISQALKTKNFEFKYVFTYLELQKYSDEIGGAMSKMDLILKEQEDNLLDINSTYRILERYIIDSLDKSNLHSESIILELKENKRELFSIWKYGYRLYSLDEIDKPIYQTLINFVKSGVLLYPMDCLPKFTKVESEKMIII